MKRHIAQAHTCFRLEIQFPLALPDGLDVFDVWHGLSYRIMREPSDLLAHVRRVLLCRQPSLRANLAGAIHDLFEVTGSAGNALKQRLLHDCRHELSTTEADRFRAMIDAGANAADDSIALSIPPAGSVLPTMAQLLEAHTSLFDGCTAASDNPLATASPCGTSLPTTP